MQYNFILIRTDKGGKYARKILNSVKWLNENRYPQHEFFTVDWTISEFLEGGFQSIKDNFVPEKTIIHARCANPRTKWTIKLRELEEAGYKVVNSVDAIELTSNKLACSLHLQDKVNHPRTWEYNKKFSYEEKKELIKNIYHSLKDNAEFIIAKPYTSLEQGANVRKIEIGEGFEGGIEDLTSQFDKVPGDKIVIQEYIPYTALHRVIVIGGKALPYTFIDMVQFHKKGDWKVSCCLNRTTMKLNENASPLLLNLAENTQRLVGGSINFIDIFEYNDNGNRAYTNAEINTACSLNIHERLAKQAGRKDYNIHYRIAKELVKQLEIR